MNLNTPGHLLTLGVWVSCSPPVIRTAVRGAVTARYLSIDGSPVALGSTGAHEVWVKQVIPHQGLTPLTEVPLAGKRCYYLPLSTSKDLV